MWQYSHRPPARSLIWRRRETAIGQPAFSAASDRRAFACSTLRKLPIRRYRSNSSRSTALIVPFWFRRATVHINKLAQRNQTGTISAVEREELERYLRVGSFLNVLQAKARLSLAALKAG